MSTSENCTADELDASSVENKRLSSTKSIKSFVLRAGRMTCGQQRGWDEKWPEWGLHREEGIFNNEKAFGREAPLILEIGFGMGHSLLEMANNESDKNFIGVEVHRPGIGALLNNAHKENLENIRVFCDDAVAVLTECIPNRSLHRIQIYFPDPWHKKKHHKRRLIQPEFIQLLHQKLENGGILHMATDWENYACQMMDVMTSSSGWKNVSGTGKYSPRPDFRPETKFERRGLKLGHPVRDLLFARHDLPV